MHTFCTSTAYAYNLRKFVILLLDQGLLLCWWIVTLFLHAIGSIYDDNVVMFVFCSQLPWKTLKNIIEYYYMWKTTDRYVQQKRVKAVEAESKLKQVYIPN